MVLGYFELGPQRHVPTGGGGKLPWLSRLGLIQLGDPKLVEVPLHRQPPFRISFEGVRQQDAHTGCANRMRISAIRWDWESPLRCVPCLTLGDRFQDAGAGLFLYSVSPFPPVLDGVPEGIQVPKNL